MAILNVEDDAPARFLRSRILERAGFSVREARNAREALALGLSKPPKLLLLDVALPDDNGFSVCERFKSVHPQVPVVMITSVYQSSASRRDGYMAGADEYLLTPVEPERLLETVSRYLAPAPNRDLAPPPTVLTDDSGTIVSSNWAAARLLNLTPRGAQERSLLMFFAEGRDRVALHMRRAAEGRIERFVARVRPRDGKPFPIRVDVSAAPLERGASLEWVIEPEDRPEPRGGGSDS